ncbi:MAG: hypothetical protein FJ170_00255 [Gammaproteobacteria bacterium]|nr:hypothetical protein [Gammaproteobacteria bacterium]
MALLKGLVLAAPVVPATAPAADAVEPVIARIESVDVPARTIRADGVDYSLSGRAVLTLPPKKRLGLSDLKPGMRVELMPAKAGATVVNRVVLLPD